MEVEGSIRVVEEPDEGTLDEPVVVTIVRSTCIRSLSLCPVLIGDVILIFDFFFLDERSSCHLYQVRQRALTGEKQVPAARL